MSEEKRKTKIYHVSETAVYVLIWGLLFLSTLFHIDSDGMQWMSAADVLTQCGELLPFFIVFLIHQLLIIQFTFAKRRYVHYIIAVVALLTLSFFTFRAIHEHFRREFMKSVPEKALVDFRKSSQEINQRYRLRNRPPRFVGPMETRMLVTSLLILANLGVYLLFRARRDEERLKEMERQQLRHELDYLKFQINPHFFMNTLNNIHALVDIDADKAKESIVGLSRLMRYALYDGDAELVPLQKDINFMQNYIALMRIRCYDSVDLQFDFPENVPNIEVPPMLIITFIENAFKHGVSYQQKSFIHASLEVMPDGSGLTFTCSNSKTETPAVGSKSALKHKESGIGLDNVRKRLALIYPNTHTMKISETEKEFNVELVIRNS